LVLVKACKTEEGSERLKATLLGLEKANSNSCSAGWENNQSKTQNSTKVGVLRASHKIFNSEVRICWNDASKFSSISSSQLTFCCL
jgi:hypothetical protein